MLRNINELTALKLKVLSIKNFKIGQSVCSLPRHLAADKLLIHGLLSGANGGGIHVLAYNGNLDQAAARHAIHSQTAASAHHLPIARRNSAVGYGICGNNTLHKLIEFLGVELTASGRASKIFCRPKD